MSALLAGAISAPLAVAALLGFSAARPIARCLVPWAAIPALAAGILVPESSASDLPWLFLGMRFGLDAFGGRLLAASALLWTIAGVAVRTRLAADPHGCRFSSFWLLVLAGNLWVVAAFDAASLYAGCALMTLAAYGLIVHEGTREGRDAGRAYLVLALAGDALLLEGLLLRARANADLLLPWEASSADGASAGVFVFYGLGVKAGVIGLHMWQPLAYRIVPGVTAAVLSSALAGAALIGWFRLLPLGGEALPGLGAAASGFGLAGAFGAALLGSAQREPKVVLAYAGMGQMGLAATALGVALTAPAVWVGLAPTLGYFALQYVLAIGALFVLVGVITERSTRAQGPCRAAAVLAALALAGCAPVAALLSSTRTASALAHLAQPWHSVVWIATPLAVAGAAAPILRLVFVLWGAPVAGKRPMPREIALPAGDLIVVLAPPAKAIWRRLIAASAWFDRPWQFDNDCSLRERAEIATRRFEGLLRRFATAGVAMAALLAALALMLWR
jgi:formate hydrogenlyase subunit 3/multisubunit Na+/H+ antiporter MnhD subunit